MSTPLVPFKIIAVTDDNLYMTPALLGDFVESSNNAISLNSSGKLYATPNSTSLTGLAAASNTLTLHYADNAGMASTLTASPITSNTLTLDTSTKLLTSSVNGVSSSLNTTSITQFRSCPITATTAPNPTTCYLSSGDAKYFSTAGSTGITINFAWSATQTLGSVMAVGDITTYSIFANTTTTAVDIASSVTIDTGTTVTVTKAYTASSGISSTIIQFIFTIIKTGATTYLVHVRK